MKNFIIKAVAASCLMITSYQANAAFSCFYQDPVFVSKAASGFAATNANIMSALVGMDVAVNVAAKAESDAVTAAIFVLSNQKSLATTQINQALKNNTQIQANAIQAINQAQRYQEAIRDYGPTGVGYDVCKVSIERGSVTETTKDTEAAIADMVSSEITARAGRYANRSESMASRLALHNKYYCTDGQAKSGMCQAKGDRGGKSLAAATLFQPADYLSSEYNDKSAFINNMVGLPDDPIPRSQATTQAGQSYADLKRRKDAIKSVAMVSLKAIQADWSSVPKTDTHVEPTASAAAALSASVKTEKEQLAKDAPNTDVKNAKTAENLNPPPATTAELKNQSLMEQVKHDVNRYLGGGKEYEDWSKTLVGQEEKGILTEVLKVKALRLYMQVQQYKQLQRMEAMLAANVAATTENSGMAGRVEAQRQIALRQSIADNLVK